MCLIEWWSNRLAFFGALDAIFSLWDFNWPKQNRSREKCVSSFNPWMNIQYQLLTFLLVHKVNKSPFGAWCALVVFCNSLSVIFLFDWFLLDVYIFNWMGQHIMAKRNLKMSKKNQPDFVTEILCVLFFPKRFYELWK